MIGSQEVADGTGREGVTRCPLPCAPPAPPVATSDGIIVQCGNQESGVGRLCFTRNKSETEIPVRPLMGLKFSVVCGIDNK